MKEADRGLMTLLGGPHASALPLDTLNDGHAFDCVVSGEAEEILPELLCTEKHAIARSGLPGVYVMQADGSISGSGRASLEQDLTEIPLPAWDLFPRVRTYPLLSERGCPYRCVFCSRNMTQRVRTRPVDHVMEEIEWLHRDFAPEAIYFEDETFGLNQNRTEELLVKLAEFNRHAGIVFKAQTRVDRVTAPMMRRMKEAGFRYVELGVESGDPQVLARSGKGTTVEQAELAVRIAREAGIGIWANFIIGLPGETKESVRNSIDLAVKMNPDRLSVAIIVAYPGCEIYDWALTGENGYRLLSKDWGRFDKYLASSLELENLRYRTMRRLQFQMYLETYLRNLRFGALSRLLWKSRNFFFRASPAILAPRK